MSFNALTEHRPSSKAYDRQKSNPSLLRASAYKRATDECAVPPLDIGGSGNPALTLSCRRCRATPYTSSDVPRFPTMLLFPILSESGKVGRLEVICLELRPTVLAIPSVRDMAHPFTALRFPVGPVDSGRADSSLPTERRTRHEGPSSAFPSASICFHFDRLTLADLHPVRAITARRLATTPPPPSVPYASIFASHQSGSNGFGVPQFHRRSC